MNINCKIEANEEGLATVLSAILDVTPGRTLWALHKSRLTMRQIMAMNVYVSERMLMLRKERMKFDENAEHYLDTFVLEDNNCIRREGEELHGLHHSLIGARVVLGRFNSLKGIRADKYRNAVTMPSLYDSSLLSAHMPMMEDMFGTQYNDQVLELCNGVAGYFRYLYQFLSDCIKLLRDEKIIKNDPTQILPIYQLFADKVIDAFEESRAWGVSPSTLANQINPLYEQRKMFDSETTFIQWLYHNGSPKTVKLYILKMKYCDEKVSDLTPEEKILFGTDVGKVHRIRYAITRFNELCHQPAKGGLKKIDAKSQACFAAWCGIKNDKKHILDFCSYFCNEYTKTEDCVDVVGEESVYRMRNVTPEEKAHFNRKLNSMLSLAEQEGKLKEAN